MSWGPTFGKRVETAVAVILRTPGLFIIEYWWRCDDHKFILHSNDWNQFWTSFVTNIALLNGFLLLLLPLSLIRLLYCHIVCGALLITAHLLSYYLVHMIDVQNGVSFFESLALSLVQMNAIKQISLLAIHVAIAIIVSIILQGPQKTLVPVFASYSLPVFARILDFPNESLQVIHKFSSAVVVITLVFHLYNWMPKVLSEVKDWINHLLVNMEIEGLTSLIVNVCHKIFVPTHFFLFWSIAFFMRLFETINDPQKDWFVSVLSAASAVCISPVSLFSTAVAVTYMSYFLLSAMKYYLWGNSVHSLTNAPNIHNKHSGWEEGMTTLLLALLTGITDMKQPARMAVLTIILFVVLSSLLQSMLEMAEPVILSLSAYHGKNAIHHIKVLILCAFLFLFPLHVTYVLSQIFPIDFWMAVVLSTSILTSAQVADLLIVHCILWYDSLRSEPMESLDEAVYYVRSFTKIIEFFVATSVVVVGVWEGITGQWSLTNAIILIIHCYFNVWQRLNTGVSSYVRRRKALLKTSSLSFATTNQLKQHNDVCAICFTDMTVPNSSIITNCNHYFHRICLRKWLCFQDTCPLCTVSITRSQSTQQQSN
ncbi:RING finger protein 145-like [Oppia nitens]|uniref:RING finger protein 145-like n=1 Tax=Oppia nitens TaxID=1686743 RepID=UPI0023DB6D4A|nr:RING finger protein 145-like [Oppia nitens]